MSLSVSTKLEAVNYMLTAIGEAPVNQLGGATVVDTAIAEQVLDEMSRSVQSIGWHFNSENNYPLSRNSDKQIQIGNDVVRVDVSKIKYPDIDVVQRGLLLYDKKNHTYAFNTDLEAEIIRLLDWTELPQPFKTYITVKAARVFQTKMVGSRELGAQLAEDELSALASLKEFEADTGDYSIFDNYSVASILDR